MRKRRILLLALPIIIVATAIGVLLLGQSTQPTSESPPPPGLPAQPRPPNLFVVPEVPLGPIGVIAACFIALLIAQKVAKKRP